VGYICRVIDFRRGARFRLGTLGLLAIVAALVALAASGCGSGSDSTTVSGGTTGSTSGSGSESTAGGKESSTPGSGSKKTAGADAKPAGGGSAGKADGKTADSTPEKRHAAKVERKLKKACPKGMDKNTCRAYIESSLEAEKGTNSTRVSGPHDCTQTMSRSQCEELLQQQQQAATEEGSSVNVQQCMAHPTPHCEEVLREEIERQQAAQQAGG